MKFEKNPLVDESLSDPTNTPSSDNVVKHPKSKKQAGSNGKFKINIAQYISAYKTKPMLIGGGACALVLILIALNWRTFSDLSIVWFKQVAEPDLPTGEVIQPLWVSQVNQLRDQVSEQIQQQKDSLENQANHLGTATQSVQRAFQQAEQNAHELTKLNTHIDELNTKFDTLSSGIETSSARPDNNEEMLLLSKALADIQSSVENISNALQTEKTKRRQLQAELAALSEWKRTLAQAKQQENESTQPNVEHVNPWKLIAASGQGNLAYVEHTGTGAKLRVILGTEIPHCGKVQRIDAPKQKVFAGDCAIGRTLSQTRKI